MRERRACAHLGDETKQLLRVRTEEEAHYHAVERDFHLR